MWVKELINNTQWVYIMQHHTHKLKIIYKGEKMLIFYIVSIFLNAYFLIVSIFYKNRIGNYISNSIQIFYISLIPIYCFVFTYDSNICVCKHTCKPWLWVIAAFSSLYPTEKLSHFHLIFWYYSTTLASRSGDFPLVN